jgi:hypothetical protein
MEKQVYRIKVNKKYNAIIKVFPQHKTIVGYMNGVQSKAVCHKDDTFDVYYGMALVYSKLLDKLNNKLDKKEETLYSVNKEIQKMFDEDRSKINIQKKEIDSLSDEVWSCLECNDIPKEFFKRIH